MNTGGTILTSAGRNMISDSIALNKEIYITRAKLGTGDILTFEEAKMLSDLVKIHKELEINSITRTGELTKIRVIFQNNDEPQPVTIKEYGIYAKLGEEGEEVLIAYSNDDPGQYMPAGGTQNIVEYQKEIYLGVSEDAVVIARIDESLVYATKEDLPKLVTQIYDGLMLSTDKKKLDGIEEGANKYVLPAATSTVMGGVKLDATLSNWIKGLFTVATQTVNGLMVSTDKKKLDEIEAGANKYVLPAATSTVMGGVKLDATFSTWLKAQCNIPVGGVLILTSAANPSTIFTGTTWSRIASNRNIRGCAEGETAGTLGGNDTVTLSIANMPSHTHTQTAHTHTRGTMDITGGFRPDVQDARGMITGTTGAFYGGGTLVYGGATLNHNYPASYYQRGEFQASRSWTGATSSIAPTIAATGSGTAFSVVNAHTKLHIWQRNS